MFRRLNYHEIARTLIPVQPMPGGALPYFPSARLTPVQQLYRHFLKQPGWMVESVIRKENQITIVLYHTQKGGHKEIVLEPKDA